MKLNEIKLLEAKKSEPLSHFEIVQYVEQKMKSRITGRDIQPEPPYRVNATAVTFSKMKIFATPLPIRFGKVKHYTANNCKELVSLAQLNIDESVSGLDVSDSGIKDLEGCPTILEQLRIDSTPISSLKGISPKIKILNMFFCKELTAIDESMPNVKKIQAAGCNIKSLKDIHKFCPNLEDLQINACPIESHILGLLKINTLKDNVLGGRAGNQVFRGEDIKLYDRLDKAMEIIHKYLKAAPGNKRVLDAQSEMLDAGLDEYAQL